MIILSLQSTITGTVAKNSQPGDNDPHPVYLFGGSYMICFFRTIFRTAKNWIKTGNTTTISGHNFYETIEKKGRKKTYVLICKTCGFVSR